MFTNAFTKTGHILVKTDISELGLNDTIRNLKKMKKLPCFRHYDDQLDTFLALQSLVAMDMDSTQYMDHIQSQDKTPYNLALENVLCFAFTGFTYLFHYFSNIYGSYDLFEVHAQSLMDRSLIKEGIILGNYDQNVMQLNKLTVQKKNAKSTSIGAGLLINVQKSFIESYIETTSNLGDRLVSPLVDHYFNNIIQKMPNMIKFFDIIAENEIVWEYYYKTVIQYYGLYNVNNYLSNFSQYTYERFITSYNCIKKIGTFQNDEQELPIEIDLVQFLPINDELEMDINDLIVKENLVEKIQDAIEEKQNEIDDSSEQEMLTSDEIQAKKNFEKQCENIENHTEKEPDLTPSNTELSTSEDEDVNENTDIDEIILNVESEHSKMFGNKIHLDMKKFSSFSFTGCYLFGIYLDGPFVIPKYKLNVNAPAYIYIEDKTFTLFTTQNMRTFSKPNVLWIRTDGFQPVQYVKMKKKKRI